MTSIDYVKNKLTVLVDLFQNIECVYQYDSIAGTHIIKVSPAKNYENNTDFEIQEMSIINEFYTIFDTETICFISENNKFKIRNITQTFAGKLFIQNKIDNFNATRHHNYNYNISNSFVS